MKTRYRKALVPKTMAALDRKRELNLNVLCRLSTSNSSMKFNDF
jgi:hypothetical protein